MAGPLVRSSARDVGGYLDLVSHLMDNRTLFVGPELTTDVASTLAMQLLVMAQEEKPISIYVNCYGGSVPAALAVMDVIDLVNRQIPVQTYCLGECIGPALLISSAGRRGRRRAFP